MKMLEWIFDYYIVYFLYNPHKIDRYHDYLRDKLELSTIINSVQQNVEIVKYP